MVDTKSIYPEASEGRLKTTDDKTKSLHEETRIISAEIETDEEKLKDSNRRYFNYSDKLIDILKFLLPLLFPLGFLMYFLKDWFYPIQVLFFLDLFAIFSLLVISLVLSVTNEKMRKKYRERKDKK